MDVKRVISAYEKNGSKLLSEFSIDSLPLKRIKEIVAPNKGDLGLYQVYPIGETELKALVVLCPEMKKFDLSKVDLYYECFKT